MGGGVEECVCGRSECLGECVGGDVFLSYSVYTFHTTIQNS